MHNSLPILHQALWLFTTTALPFGDIFVDQNAANCAAGAGTAADPVCTINSAIGIASPGDTIRIAPGFYQEYITLGMDLDLIGTGGQEITTIAGDTTPGVFGSVVTIPLGTTATLDGLTVRDGRTQIAGGGIHVEGNLLLKNSTVTENEINVFVNGGGIGAKDGTANIVIENSTISNNDATTGNGGGISAICETLIIRNSTITGNYVDPNLQVGGGIAVFGLVDISNTTISGNTGREFYAQTSPGSAISNSTIVGTNFIQFYVQGNLDLRNTIIVSDGPSSNGTMYGNITSLGNNIIGAFAPYGTSIVDGVNGDQFGQGIDAMLGPLQDNGGPTETHALLPGSPAINAGHATVFEPLDQRGVARPVQSIADIGAFEFGGVLNRDLCNGDGGNQLGCTNCPCVNNAPAGTVGGCLNRIGSSARLSTSGSSSVSLPSSVTYDLRFALAGIPASTFSVLTSGDGVAPSNAVNPCFGLDSGVQSASFDGLRCAIINTRRHGGRAADANGEIGTTNNPWGGEGGPPIGIARTFGGFASGQTRYFQAIYREDALASCMRGLNTSQAIEVVFTP